jgi:hypothetical protein
MPYLKKILISLLVILIALQFFRPEKNIAEGISEADITYAIEVPSDISSILVEKCYDCHSHNTQYPWYFNLQPIAWWMADHIRHGKEELNFSDFKNYSERKANHKLEEISELIRDDEMPLPSFTLVHQSAKLTAEEKSSINAWIKSMGLQITE